MKSFWVKAALCIVLSFALAGCFKSAAERAAAHLESGRELAAQGDLPRAIVEFRNTLKYDENNLDAYREMGRAYVVLAEVPRAYASFLRVVEQVPDDVEGRIRLSEMAFSRENWDEFDRHSSALAGLGSDITDAQAVALAAAYRQAVLGSDGPRAAALITQAEALAADVPENVILQRIRIDAYVTAGRYPDAITTLDDSLARDAGNADLYLAKLDLQGRLNDEAGMESTLDAMLLAIPDDRRTQETYLAFLLARDRTDDAEAFLEGYLASAAAEDENGALLSLIAFLRGAKGDDAALARADAAIADPAVQNPMWQVARAGLIFEMGQRDAGIAAMRDVLADGDAGLSKTEVLNTQTTLARMLLVNGDQNASRALVSDVLATDPRLPNALRMRAAWLIGDDDTSAAINDLRVALDGDPGDPDTMVLMADAYARAGDRDLQQNFLARAAEAANNAPRYALLAANALAADEKLLQAEGTLISSLRRVPGNVDVLGTLGQIYLQLDDRPRAEQVARELSRIETAQAQSFAQGLQAELVARRVGVDEALAFLEEQTAQDGDVVATALTMIRARLKSGRVDDAVRTAKSALDANPEDLRLRNALAVSYVTAGDFAAAQAEYETLIAANPKAPGMYLQLARMQAAQGDLDAGAAVIDAGLAASPEAPDLLWAKASYLETAGDITGAIAIYEDLYAENSDSLVVANNLASLLASVDDDPQTLARAEVISRRLRGTEVPALQDTYGYIQFRRGNLQDALTYLEPAAASLAGDARVQFHLAQTYAALDRRDDAVAQLNRALAALGPLGDDDFRGMLQAQITQLEASADDG